VLQRYSVTGLQCYSGTVLQR